MEEYYLAALQRVSGMGSVQLRRMLEFFASGKEIWEAPMAELASSGAAPGKLLAALDALRRERPDYPEQLAEICRKKGIRVCSLFSGEYPPFLKEILDPPLAFFYRGKLPSEEALCLGVVGSRHFSRYGEQVALDLAEKLAAAGVVVVSGAARGIDTCAHLGAMKAGRTVAVLGCGVDVAYPAENRALLQEIAEQGAVISEYAPGTSPLPAFFPARNRIISGMSRGVVVVEAARRSGSLITAELALNEGRDIFAVPGSVFSDTSKGCNHLIQQGAKLVTCAQDILVEYGKPEGRKRARKEPELSCEEAAVYRVLSYEHPLSVDEIIYSLKGEGDAASISCLLLRMELKGLVVEKSHAYLRAERE